MSGHEVRAKFTVTVDTGSAVARNRLRQPTNFVGYEGRGSTLLYANMPGTEEYRWFEVPLMAGLGMLSSAMTPLAHQTLMSLTLRCRQS